MLLLGRSGSGIGIFGVKMVEILNAIPARQLAAPSYFERMCVISFD